MSQLSNIHSSGSKRRTQCPNAFRVSGTVLRPSRTSKHSCCSRRWWSCTRCEKSLLVSYGIHRRRRFAFEVNGEHGSVKGWEDYSTHAGDAGVVTTTLWCRQLTKQSGGAQLLSIINRQLVQYFGLYRTGSADSRTIGFAVLLALRRFYCFINNISATTQF